MERALPPRSSSRPLARGATQPISELQQRLQENPSDVVSRIELARACLLSGELGEAFLHLRLAESSAMHRGQVQYLMGLAHLRTGDVEAAVDELLCAERALPESAEVASALEEALERLTA